MNRRLRIKLFFVAIALLQFYISNVTRIKKVRTFLWVSYIKVTRLRQLQLKEEDFRSLFTDTFYYVTLYLKLTSYYAV